MAVTTKQIAELVGVSRGTVDRALHDRGRVDPEVARRVKQVAEELGYQPNAAGRALALTRNPIKIGMVVQSSETAFMQMVLSGIRKAREELRVFGVEILLKRLRSVGAEQVVRAMDALLEEGASGIALLPVDDDRVRKKINAVCGGKGVPVVTFHSDIPETARMCFVGLDNFRSGQTAAGLMEKALSGPDGCARGSVLVVTGHPLSDAHNRRVEGFCSELAQIAPEVSLLPVAPCLDDDRRACRIVEKTLSEMPSLNGIFVAANGQNGVCRAVEASGVQRRPYIVTYDLTPQNKEHLLDGSIDFAIGQDSFTQGYEPVMILYRYLFSGEKPKREHFFTEILIKTKYNL